MADRQLTQILNQLKTQSPSLSSPDAAALLSKAKLLLLQLDALTPTSKGASNNPSLLAAARSIYEQGALCSIRAWNPDAFLRYVSQLAPFYELPETGAAVLAERNKVTGLYLLLLLTQARYAEFHSELEALAARGDGSVDVENDRYLGYPIRLERWLMEGSYDRVWKAMKKGEVPCEEYGVFSEVSPLFYSFLSILCALEVPTNNINRFSRRKSASRSPAAASGHIPPYRSPPPSRSSSSSLRVPSYSLPVSGAGSSRTVRSSSPPQTPGMKVCRRRR